MAGRSGPPGQGDSRSTGIWLCSGSQSDSKPRASAACASTAGWMLYSVGKMVRPMCMRYSPLGKATDTQPRPLLERGATDFQILDQTIGEAIDPAVYGHILISRPGRAQHRGVAHRLHLGPHIV